MVALGGVGGFGEFGHQWLIGVDFTGEEFSCALLTFGDIALARHSEQAPSALALRNVAAVGCK